MFYWISINVCASFVKIPTAVPLLGPPEQKSPGQMMLGQLYWSDVTWVNDCRVQTNLYGTCGLQAISSFKIVNI